MDTTKLGLLTAQLMERLEADHWKEDAEIADVTIVVNVEDKDYSVFLSACSDDRRWVEEAMLYKAIDNLDVRLQPIEDDE